ncbi:S41 family peptidase [Litoribrevibacter albus]|uniref:Tail specific protease domain-containing protein n=1 Tax=Litoribrevibacter albus TaxID=1473156 RepID=A0AA37SD30_9GAMM|nr:S41 family peptidase [Litoribrevibacter albus]GLQ32301.1 hypothetical protein GCM10007876_27800 [Litoribrevibacter albus]
MKYWTSTTALLAALVLTGCGHSDSEKSNLKDLEQYQGTWLAPAYGQGLEFKKARLIMFDYTEDYCLISNEVNDIELKDLQGAFILSGNQIELKDGFGAKNLYTPGPVFNKVDEKPTACQNGFTPKVGDNNYQDNIQDDLEYFYQALSELSISIDFRGVDWDAMYQLAETNLLANPTDQQLITELVNMIRPLRDGHTTLGSEDNEIYFTAKPLFIHLLLQEYADGQGIPQLTTEEQFQAALEYAEAQLELMNDIIFSYADSDEDIRVAANDQLAWYQVDGIGYLQIAGMEGFTSQEDSDHQDLANLNALETAIDQAIDDLQDTDGLIIDVRRNTGGDDFLALAIASRFTDSERLAYQKQARLGNSMTPLRDVSISPRGDKQYLKPVVLLTSATTSSAAEVFTLTMRELPQVTLLGEKTQGSFSDSLDKHTPRGLPFALSNEIYRSVEGVWYEGLGVPVDIEMTAFELQERQNEEDLMLEAAFERLN